MPQLSLHRDVGSPAPVVYDVIADVACYPEFLPGFYAVRTDGYDGDALRVFQTVGGLGLKVTFLSRATFDRPSSIRIVSDDAPFHHLHQTWTVTERGPQRSTVRLDADYALSEPLVGVVFDRLYPSLMRRSLAALVERVRRLQRSRPVARSAPGGTSAG